MCVLFCAQKLHVVHLALPRIVGSREMQGGSAFCYVSRSQCFELSRSHLHTTRPQINCQHMQANWQRAYVHHTVGLRQLYNEYTINSNKSCLGRPGMFTIVFQQLKTLLLTINRCVLLCNSNGYLWLIFH